MSKYLQDTPVVGDRSTGQDIAGFPMLLQWPVLLPHALFSLSEQGLQLAHFIGQFSELALQGSACTSGLSRRCQAPLQRTVLLQRLTQLLDLLDQGMLPCYTTSGCSRCCFPF